MPTVKILASQSALEACDFPGKAQSLIGAIAEIMDTQADKVHVMGVPVIIARGLAVAHVQIEYLPTPNRTEAFIAQASDAIGRLISDAISQDVRVRSWPTHGVAMAAAKKLAVS